MHIVVTGAAGFIGSNFVDLLLGKYRHRISHLTMIDSLTYAGKKSNFIHHLNDDLFSFIEADITDANKMTEVFENVDAVVNFAAESHVDRSIEDSRQFVISNVLGVHNLLELMRERTHIRLIQVSTDEVYGSIESGSWDENSPLLPNSPYSASKAGGDLLARAYQQTYGLDVVITRCTNNYGPRQDSEKLIPRFIEKLMKGQQVPLYGDGRNIRDWLYVEDHCEALWLVLNKGKAGQIYHIGGGKEISNKELTLMLLRAFKLGEHHIDYVPDRLGHDYRYSLDWTKTARELDYSPKVNFEEGLFRTIAWYRQNAIDQN